MILVNSLDPVIINIGMVLALNEIDHKKNYFWFNIINLKIQI